MSNRPGLPMCLQKKLESKKNKVNIPYDTVFEVDIDKVIPDKNQPRKNFSKLDNLKHSIKTEGQLQPIFVLQDENGMFKIVDGERRYHAIKNLIEDGQDLKVKILCFEKKDNPYIGMIINMFHKGYSPFEIAKALNVIKNDGKKLTDQQIGDMIGKSRQNVGEYLSLLSLPDKIIEREISNSTVPFNKLKRLAAQSDMSNEEKIEEYEKLLLKYSKATDSQNLKDNTQNESKKSKKSDKVDNAKIPISKKFSAMTKRLDATSSALEKFKIDKINNPEDRQVLFEKLDKIISDAQKMKKRLNMDAEK